MAVSVASADRKFPLSGINVLGRVFDLCRLEAVSLQEGGMSGMVGSHQYGDATLCSFAVDFAFHGRFVLPAGRQLICHFHRVAPGSWCAGMPLHADTVLIVLPESPCELMLGPESSVSIVIAPLQAGALRAIEKNRDSYGPAGKQFSLFRRECHAGTLWSARYAAMFESLAGAPGRDVAGLVGDGFADMMADESNLHDLFAHVVPHVRHASTRRPHYSTFRKVGYFMRTHLQRDIYVEEVAKAVQVSDRTLRHVFDDFLGISPTRYLSLLRLHEASRQLSVRNVGKLSIKSVDELWLVGSVAVRGQLPSRVRRTPQRYADALQRLHRITFHSFFTFTFSRHLFFRFCAELAEDAWFAFRICASLAAYDRFNGSVEL